MKPIVTIFTPTYNRKDKLVQLYNSLKTQTNKNFEWVIVDDGSTDDTDMLVKQWKRENNDFQIIYKKFENGGKHRAINRGLDLSNGILFFIVDSDDYIIETAIETIIEKEKTLKKINDKIGGIAFNKGYSNNDLIGTTFKGNYVDCTSIERKKYNINGDKSEIFYTDILRLFKFPEIEGEKFVTEALVWNRIAASGYKLRWYQDILTICEYLPDGLSSKGSSIFSKSPKGLLIFLNEYISFFNVKGIRKLLKYEYYSNAIYNNKNIIVASKDLKIKPFVLRIAIFIRKIINIVK